MFVPWHHFAEDVCYCMAFSLRLITSQLRRHMLERSRLTSKRNSVHSQKVPMVHLPCVTVRAQPRQTFSGGCNARTICSSGMATFACASAILAKTYSIRSSFVGILCQDIEGITVRTLYATPASQLAASFLTVTIAQRIDTGTLVIARLEAA